MKLQLILCLCLFNTVLLPQNIITRENQLWSGIQIKKSLSPKQYLIFEAEERIFYPSLKQSLWMTRIQYHCLKYKNFDFSFGSAFFSSNNGYINVPEIWPHIELLYSVSKRKLKFTNRFRTELRYSHNVNKNEITNGYTGNFRFRNRIGFEYEI